MLYHKNCNLGTTQLVNNITSQLPVIKILIKIKATGFEHLRTLIKQLGSKIYIFSKNSGMENAKFKNKTKTRLEFAKISNG